MNHSKLPYSAPESSIFCVSLKRTILDLSNEDRSMTTFSGNDDTAGDRDGGIGGNDYTL